MYEKAILPSDEFAQSTFIDKNLRWLPDHLLAKKTPPSPCGRLLFANGLVALIVLFAASTYGAFYFLQFLYQLAIEHKQVELSFLPIITGIFTLPCWRLTKCYPFLSSQYVERFFSKPSNTIIILAALSAGIFLLTAAYRFPNNVLNKWVKIPVNQTNFLHKMLTITEIGINIEDNLGNISTLVWQTFGRILQTKDFFYLETQEDYYIIIPKPQLNTEEIQYIDGYLKQYVNDQYQY